MKYPLIYLSKPLIYLATLIGSMLHTVLHILSLLVLLIGRFFVMLWTLEKPEEKFTMTIFGFSKNPKICTSFLLVMSYKNLFHMFINYKPGFLDNEGNFIQDFSKFEEYAEKGLFNL